MAADERGDPPRIAVSLTDPHYRRTVERQLRDPGTPDEYRLEFADATRWVDWRLRRAAAETATTDAVLVAFAGDPHEVVAVVAAQRVQGDGARWTFFEANAVTGIDRPKVRIVVLSAARGTGILSRAMRTEKVPRVWTAIRVRMNELMRPEPAGPTAPLG